MSSVKRKSHASYDIRVRRFRDASGRFLSRARGLKSKYARTTYLRSISKPKAPRKALPPIRIAAKARVKKTRLKPVKPPKKIPSYYQRRVAGVRGQQIINGVGSWGAGTLAALLLKQINRGYIRFRFWYKIVKSGFIYSDKTLSGSKLGSTYPITWSVLTNNKKFDEIVDFLRGRDQYINGKIVYYWISKRF